jgi:hypothetical protein
MLTVYVNLGDGCSIRPLAWRADSSFANAFLATPFSKKEQRKYFVVCRLGTLI